MAEIIIRPTQKLIRFGYTVTITVICIALFAYNNYFPDYVKWPLLIPALLLLWPITRHIRQRFTTMRLNGDRLRYEAGMFSKTMRTIQLSKVQNVRVDQSFFQRLLGTGDIFIETSGETSLLSMRNVDEPTSVADEIMEAAQGTPFRSPAAKRKAE